MKDCFGDKKYGKISKESKRMILLCSKDFIILITSEGLIFLENSKLIVFTLKQKNYLRK